MTLRPFGPSVTLTALLRMSTPRSMRSRASLENLTSLADMISIPEIERKADGGVRPPSSSRRRAFDHAHDVGFLHDQEVLAVDLDFRAGPFAEQDPVAGFQFERLKLAALVAGAGPDGDDLALLRLLLDGVGNDDAALRLVLAFDAADDDAVVQGSEFHGDALSVDWPAGSRAMAPASAAV